jgi:hypothetical protein
MKNISLVLVCAISCANAIADDFVVDSKLLLSGYMEFVAKGAMEYAESARTEDFDKVLRLSCLQLEFSLEHIDLAAYDRNEKVLEVTRTKEKASALFEELKAQGFCD